MVLMVVVFLLLFQASLEDNNILDNLFHSVNMLVNYYKENFVYMNLDGIYGLRTLEGMSTAILHCTVLYNSTN